MFIAGLPLEYHVSAHDPDGDGVQVAARRCSRQFGPYAARVFAVE